MLTRIGAICAFSLVTLMPLVQGQQEAQIFAKDVISTGHEFTLTFTPNGRDLFFTRSDLAKKINHIMHSRWSDGGWQPAEPVEFSSPDWSDLDPALSPDGKRLFFISTRPKPGETVKNSMDLWVVERKKHGWGELHWIENVNSSRKEGSPAIDRKGNLCFFSDREAAGVNRIYCSEKSDKGYTAPTALGPQINSGKSDTSPWLSPDGRLLLFYSERDGGSGKADLYLSVKDGDTWGEPANLGSTVNTEAFEYNPSLSPDGKTLYFGRDRALYSISVDAVKPLLDALHKK